MGDEPKLLTITAEPPSPNAVAKLEEVLERARDGDLSSVAIAVVYRDGSTDSAWSKAPSYPLLLGAIDRMAHKINLRLDNV